MASLAGTQCQLGPSSSGNPVRRSARPAAIPSHPPAALRPCDRRLDTSLHLFQIEGGIEDDENLAGQRTGRRGDDARAAPKLTLEHVRLSVVSIQPIREKRARPERPWTGDTKGMLLVPGTLLVTSTPRCSPQGNP